MYKHILIATDGSELAGKAVTTGLALAKQLGAKATAVTAIDPWTGIVTSEATLGEEAVMSISSGPTGSDALGLRGGGNISVR